MSFLARVVPDFRAASVLEISPSFLREQQIRALLLDVDNTLVPWHGEIATPEVHEWVAGLSAEGVGMCLLSNTHRKRRLQMLGEALGIHYVLGGGKPLRRGFLHALERLQARPEETAMVGDQLLTDILGGKRCALRTILVDPISSHEFWGTRVVHRSVERILFRTLDRRGVRIAPIAGVERVSAGKGSNR